MSETRYKPCSACDCYDGNTREYEITPGYKVLLCATCFSMVTAPYAMQVRSMERREARFKAAAKRTFSHRYFYDQWMGQGDD